MTRHRRGSLLMALLAASLSVSPRAHTEPTVQARERVAYVSVLDARTLQPVDRVTADMLSVREDGVAREILRVSPATSPLALAVLIDNSQAAAPAIPDLRTALTSFMEQVKGLGPTALFTVADRPTVLQEYTTTTATLLQAVQRLFHGPNSGATLLDTIAEVSRGLTRRETDRAAMVIVSGEYTEYSNLHYSDVLDRLRASGAMMSAVVLTNPQGSMTSDEARNRATVLDRGPRESGGLRRDVLTSMSFDTQLAVVGAMLRSQYRVVYARPESLIPPDRFQISATRPGLEAYGAPARGQEKK